jgi:predicted RND superfamily exporter protein
MFTETNLTRTQRLLSTWVLLIQHNAVAVLVVSVLLTLGTLWYSAANFKMNADIRGMMSDKLSYRGLYKEFSRAFPQQSDTVVIVIDGITAEQAGAARKAQARPLPARRTLPGRTTCAWTSTAAPDRSR